MQRIRVNTATMDAQASELDSVAAKLGQISSTVNYVSNSLTWKISVSAAVKAQLRQQSANVQTLGDRSHRLSTAVRNASLKYQATENQLAGKSGPESITGGTTGSAASGSTGTSEAKSIPDWLKNLYKMIASAGPVGAGVTLLANLITNGLFGTDWQITAMTGLKDAAKVVSGVAGIASESSFDWKALLGFNASKNKSFGELFADQFPGLDGTTAGNIKCVAKWAGHVLTVGLQAYDNYLEVKDGEITAGRAVAETVVESGIKIAEGALIGAAVGAIAGTVGAPVVVAGVVTVGVTWAVDAALDYIVGDDWVETVSDGIIDFGKNVYEGGKQVVSDIAEGAKKVGNAISDAGKTISGWWNKAFAW